MCPDKTDIHSPYRKLYHSYQPVIVSTNIEYIVLITYIINRIETFPYVGEILPVGIPYFMKPILQCCFRCRMT